MHFKYLFMVFFVIYVTCTTNTGNAKRWMWVIKCCCLSKMHMLFLPFCSKNTFYGLQSGHDSFCKPKKKEILLLTFYLRMLFQTRSTFLCSILRYRALFGRMNGFYDMQKWIPEFGPIHEFVFICCLTLNEWCTRYTI